MKFVEFEFTDNETEYCVSVPLYVVEFFRSDNPNMWSHGIRKYLGDRELGWDTSKYKIKEYLNKGSGKQSSRLKRIRDLVIEEVDGLWMYT